MSKANNTTYGLNDETIARIKDILARHGEVEEAMIYGSRAKGTFRPGSDIDIAVKGRAVDLHVLNKISHDLDELPIPYTIDVSIYDRIDNSALRDHIDRVGKMFYKRQARESNSICEAAKSLFSCQPAKKTNRKD